jgi:CRP-like cAMP-binding protein
MHNQLKYKINEILHLPENLLEIFWDKFDKKDISKGDFFLKEGAQYPKLALVEKGSFYSFYQKDGKEIIEGFCFEGCFMTDYPAFLHRGAAKKNLKALENATILTLTVDDLNQLYAENCLFERAGRLMAEQLFAQWESKLQSTIFLSPSERYQKLIDSHSKILQRVPQYLIASYLNITPQYLSQIRRSLIS